jgi:hypothetical protein
MFYTRNSKLLKIAMAALITFSFTSCSDDDDDAVAATTQPSLATLSVSSQVISQNTVMVEMIDIPADGWIVIHADNGSNGPVVPTIISMPTYVEAGANQNIEVAFTADATLTNGDQVWVMLHEDTGTNMLYEFDGNSSLDPPFIVNGAPVMTPITISAASISSPDMAVNNNTVVLPEVVAAADGWLVIHNDNGSGGIVLPGIIGQVLVSKGVNTNVTVQLDASVTITPGQSLFPMLHLDNGVIGQYEFDGVGVFDGPEVFGNNAFPGNVIFTSFTVTP